MLWLLPLNTLKHSLTVTRSRDKTHTELDEESHTRGIKPHSTVVKPPKIEFNERKITKEKWKKQEEKEGKKDLHTESGVKVLSYRTNRGNFNLFCFCSYFYRFFFSSFGFLALAPHTDHLRAQKLFIFSLFGFGLVYSVFYFVIFFCFRFSRFLSLFICARWPFRLRRRDAAAKVPFNCDYLIFIGAYENHWHFARHFDFHCATTASHSSISLFYFVFNSLLFGFFFFSLSVCIVIMPQTHAHHHSECSRRRELFHTSFHSSPSSAVLFFASLSSLLLLLDFLFLQM